MTRLFMITSLIFIAIVATLVAWNTHKDNVELKGEYAECRKAVAQAKEVVAIERELDSVDVDKWLFDADLIRNSLRYSPDYQSERE